MATTPTTTTREPAKVVADIIQEQLDLDAKHVVLENEKNFIPPDRGLYVRIGDQGFTVISNVNEIIPDPNNGGQFLESQTSTLLHIILVDMMSYDGSARVRKHEVPMALLSVYSRNLQAQYCMQIARNPGPPVNATSAEPQKLLNRFVFHVAVTAVHRKVRTGASYIKTQNPDNEVITNA